MRSRSRFRVVAVVSAFGACVTTPLLAATPAVTPAAPVRAAAPATAPATKPATLPAVAAPAARPTPAPVAGKPGAPEPLPTMDEMKQLFEQAKYADVLKQFSRVVNLRGKAAEPYNKYELWMLKFETHMKMKAQAPAVAALRDAQNTTDDVKKINYCKGVDLLIKKSKNFQYQPGANKKEKPPAIDIIDADSRKVALRALLSDEMAIATPKVEKALNGQSLAEIAQAVQSLQGFDVLESAADGGDETQKLIGDLRTRGTALLAKTVLRQTARTDDISKSANELIRIQVAVPGVGGQVSYEYRMRKRGLGTDDWRELRDIVKLADDLIPNIKGLAAATGAKPKDVEDLLNAAEDLKRKADKAQKANYNEN